MMMMMTDKKHLDECMNLLVLLVILQPRNSIESHFFSLQGRRPLDFDN